VHFSAALDRAAARDRRAYALKHGWCKKSGRRYRQRREAGARRDPLRDRAHALVGATPDTLLGTLERVLCLTAAMTGMRRGEVLALRWGDVDSSAG